MANVLKNIPWKRIGLLSGILLVVILGIGVTAALYVNSESGRSRIVQMTNDALKSDQSLIYISEINGNIFSNIQIPLVQLSDQEGIWLELRELNLNWSPNSLLYGKAMISTLNIAEIEFIRSPLIEEEDEEENNEPFSIPSLPIDIEITEYSVGMLKVSDALTEVASQFNIKGALKLTEDNGIIVNSYMTNTVGQGDDILLDILLPNNASTLKADITINAPKDGFLNSFSDAIPNEDITFKFNGSGPINNWSGNLLATISGQTFTEGHLRHVNDDWLLSSNFDVRPFVDPSMIDIVGQSNTLDIKYANSELDASLISNIANINISGIDRYDFVIDIINPGPINQMISPNYLKTTKINGHIIPFSDMPQLTLNLENMTFGVKNIIETSMNGRLNATVNNQVINVISNGELNDINGTAVDSVSGLLKEGIHWETEVSFDQSNSDTELKQLSILNQNFQFGGAGRANFETGALNVDVVGEIENLKNIVEGLALEQQLSGGVVLNSNIQSAGQSSPLEVMNTLKAENIDLANPILNELIGTSPAIKAALSRTPNGAITLSNTTFDGAFVDFEAEAIIEENQEISNAVFNLSFSDIGNMKSFEGAKLNGDIAIKGDLSGNINSPSINAETSFNAFKIETIELQDLKAELTAENIVDDLRGVFKVTAESNLGDMQVNSDFSQNDEIFLIPSLKIIVGPYEASGAFEIPKDSVIVGEMGIITKEIEQTEKNITGIITANLKLLKEDAAQKIEFSSEIRDFSMLLNDSDLLTLASSDISAQALMKEELSLSLNLKLSQLMLPSFESQDIQLDVQQQTNGYGYEVALNGTEKMPYTFDLNGAVTNINENEQLISIALSGSIDETPISLAEEAEIRVNSDGFNISPMNLRIGDGNINSFINFQKNKIDGMVSVKDTDLKPLYVFLPDLPFTGLLNGNLNVASEGGSLISNFDYGLSQITLKQQDAFNSDTTFARDKAEIFAAGTINEEMFQVSGSFNFNDYFDSKFSARLPVNINTETFDVILPEDQNIQGELTWKGDVTPIWPILQLIDHDLSGDVNADIALSGTYASPDLDGRVTMKNGRYENMQSGFVADSIEMTAILKDRHFTLDQFSANDGGEGKINANADIIINPDFSYTARAGLILESAELVRQPELQLRASTDLSFEKSLDKTSLSGDITVENASIGAVEQGGVAIAELDVTEINDEGTLQAQKKQEDALGPINLDLNLVVPNQLFVTSYGLDSEWGADLKISGTSEEPIIGGTANLIRGFFEFSGKRFELKRGNFAFPNDKSNDPVIEIAAEHAMLEMTANLRIFGKASNPKLELSSTPYLPENEVLSRILFGTSVAELTAVEAVQLASAVYSLSNGGGQGILGGIRRAIGVDRLSIDNDNGREYGTTITGGKYLTNNVYVEVSTAPATGETATSVEIDLTRNLSLVTRRTMDNDNNLSVRWFWDY